MMLDQLWQRASEFDVVHFHIDYLHFPLFRQHAGKTLTTLHGRLDLPFLNPIFRHFQGMPLVSISMHQRQPMPYANWVGNVQHGLPSDLLPYQEAPSWDYLAFLGRICPEKRVDRAIRIAKRAGMKLKIAAKIDKVDREYFKTTIEPMLDDPLIEFVGEVSDAEKRDFLGNAYAMLFPIDWPEPFGLVMIKSMACGVPVIAWRKGSVSEVIEHGLTGMIVDSEDEAVRAVKRASMLNRLRIRQRFEERFTAERMANDYLALYEQAADRDPRAVTCRERLADTRRACRSWDSGHQQRSWRETRDERYAIATAFLPLRPSSLTLTAFSSLRHMNGLGSYRLNI